MRYIFRGNAFVNVNLNDNLKPHSFHFISLVWPLLWVFVER